MNKHSSNFDYSREEIILYFYLLPLKFMFKMNVNEPFSESELSGMPIDDDILTLLVMSFDDLMCWY